MPTYEIGQTKDGFAIRTVEPAMLSHEPDRITIKTLADVYELRIYLQRLETEMQLDMLCGRKD